MFVSIKIFVIALMVQAGLAIKCFTCDSESNDACANMSDTSIKAEECNYEQLRQLENNYNRHWLLKISDIHYRPGKGESSEKLDTQMVCQKLVGTDEHKHRTVVRRCQLSNIQPCDFSRQQLRQNQEIECELCEKDACNGSLNNYISAFMVGITTSVIISLHLVL